MTGRVDFLSALVDSSESVCLADGNKISAKSMGSCKLTVMAENGESKIICIKNVLFVPGLAGNLLSVSRIVDEGFLVSFNSGRCQISKDGKVVITGERKGGLYCIKQVVQQSVLSAVGHSDLFQHLWHEFQSHKKFLMWCTPTFVVLWRSLLRVVTSTS